MKVKELKAQLKEWSKEIKQAKEDLKNAQRKFSARRDDFDRVEFSSWHFRCNHIAYCMFKGTPYEKIERPAEGNEIDMKYIEQLIANIEPTEKYENEISCTC